MGRPAITSFIVREEHSVLKFGMGGGGLAVQNSNWSPHLRMAGH